jgi:cysteinyl-tRNA synthetase
MAERILGLDFEVHGGGSDLVFPHHENEIAQTEAARGKPLARIWMHNGMVEMGEEKMAKSVGNIRLLHVALDEYGRDALVMYFVAGHYRRPLAFSEDALEDAARSAERIRDLCRRLDDRAPAPEVLDEYVERFFAQLADDFNTAGARAVLFEWVAEANRLMDRGERVGVGRLREALHLIGMERLLEPDVERVDPEAERLLDEREQARAGLRHGRPKARRARGARFPGARHARGAAPRPPLVSGDPLRPQPGSGGAARAPGGRQGVGQGIGRP